MKRSDGTAALSWANDTRATADTRITATEFRVLCVIAGGCRTRAEISAAAGCSESTVPRAVRKLEKIGALKREQNPGKANDYVVQVRPDTGTSADTGIATGRTKAATRISKVAEPTDTGASTDTASAVDNDDALIRNASARVENKSSSIELELYSETVESSGNSAPRKFLNGSAKGMLAHELSSKLIEITNNPLLDARNHKLAATCGELRALIDDGADFDADIVPVVLDLCARKRGGQITTWKYFTSAIRAAAADRMAIERQGANPIPPAEAKPHDSTPSTSVDGIRIRREPVSPATAARLQRRARREAERQPIDFGRVDSERVE